MEETIKEALKKFEIEISQKKIEKLVIFLSEIKEKNKKINLVSEKDKDNLIERHLIDSLIPLKFNELKNIIISSKNMLDIGSGGGFPAIPLAIVFENLDITLSESIKKKYEFLLWLKYRLKLDNIKIINERINQKHKNIYDLITQRAVAKFEDVLKISLAILKEDGFFISWLSMEDALKYKNLFNFIYNYNLNKIDFAICGIKKGDKYALI